MTDAPDADMHVVDLTETFPRDESDRLVRWGASFLTCGDEDVVIRSGSLAVEYYEHVRRQNKRRHRPVTTWQCRLTALALLAAACRERAKQLHELHEGDGQVRH
jgi:hypothetical protein